MLGSEAHKAVRRAVRVEDVAREAGVSPITVSRALHRPDKVRTETRLRVEDAVARTGYVVNSFASSLRSGRSPIIPVFTAALSNVQYTSAMQGAVEAMEGSGYHMMFSHTGYSAARQLEAVSSMLPFRPAGAMFVGLIDCADTRAALRALDIPVVEMWGAGAGPVDMQVRMSDAEGGRLVGEHFGALGYRRVAYAGHAFERGADRLSGFRKGLARHGLDVALVMPLDGQRSVGDGIAAFDKVLAELPDCDAIFFGSDILAAGGALRAHDLGIAVPGRVAIAGYGDLDFTAHLHPPLTSVHVDAEAMGRLAGTMLRRRLSGLTVSRPLVTFPVSLAARASTLR